MDGSVRRIAGAGVAKPRQKLNRKRLAVTALAVVVVTAGAGYGDKWWTVGRFIESTDDAYVGGDITVMAPKVSGIIAKITVADNQPVHAGDLLLTLDDRDYRAALAKAEAAVEAQQAALANLDAHRQLQEAVVAETQAAIVAASAAETRDRADQERMRVLSASAVASVQSFQHADAAFRTSQAGTQQARAAFEAAQRQLDVIASEKRQAEAALAGAMADRDTAKLNLSYTELRAPIDGTIGNRSARIGSYATVGAQLLSVIPAQGLWVDANFKENQLAAMRAGQSATITADAAPGMEFHGRITSLAPATGAEFSILPPENATGNFTKIVQRVPVRIALEGDAAALNPLRPGLSVSVDVDERGKDR
ncbi:MAG TPA: HlyD family secretion protein [Stellaceae bacterium]|nr:HlyD family secretion protein [Stellaceae bacterium]